MSTYNFSTQKELFGVAIAILEDYNIDEWSFGGGTALSYCYYNHRMSYDIDIFLENFSDLEKLIRNQVDLLKKLNITFEKINNTSSMLSIDVIVLNIDVTVLSIDVTVNNSKLKINFFYSSSLTENSYLIKTVFGFKNIKVHTPTEIITKLLENKETFLVVDFVDIIYSEMKEGILKKLEKFHYMIYNIVEEVKTFDIDKFNKELYKVKSLFFKNKADVQKGIDKFLEPLIDYSMIFLDEDDIVFDLEANPFVEMKENKEKIKQSENIGMYITYTEKISEFEWDIYLEVKNGKKEFSPIKILSINERIDSLTIYPFISFQNHPYFLEQKHDIPIIILEGFGVVLSDNIEELKFLISLLPTGIYNKLDYGYGLQKQYHVILNYIPCSYLVISKTSKTQIKEDSYILNYDDYELLRKTIDRITNQHRREALEEKNVLVYNALLHQIDSKKYPEKYQKYKKDTIYNILITQSKSNSVISEKDKKVVVDVVKNNTKEIYQTNKVEVLELVDDIELINLEDLILKIEDKINSKKDESYWQKLFNDNPFILSLAFSFPIIKIGEQISVGGRSFSGSSGKITDFLLKNKLTDNIAIVEIKKSHSQLIQKTEYRGGIYAPSKELSGSINQILDQKFHLQQEFVQIMHNSKTYDVQNYYINCLLIIGKTPENDEQKKSFELFRNNSKDITIVTFDELLDKLKNLYEFLSKEKKEDE